MSTSPFTKSHCWGHSNRLTYDVASKDPTSSCLVWRIQKCCPQQSNSLEPTLDGFAPFRKKKRKGQPLKITGNTWKQQVLDRECRVFVNKIKGSKNSLLRWAKAFMVQKNDEHQTSQDWISLLFLSVFAFYFGSINTLPSSISHWFKQTIKFSAENPASKLLELLDIPGFCSTAPWTLQKMWHPPKVGCSPPCPQPPDRRQLLLRRPSTLSSMRTPFRVSVCRRHPQVLINVKFTHLTCVCVNFTSISSPLPSSKP